MKTVVIHIDKLIDNMNVFKKEDASHIRESEKKEIIDKEIIDTFLELLK